MVTAFVLSVWADDPVFNQQGIGARAMAMGRAHVALSSDFSAVYWNPAGLGFTPVREIQIGLEGIKLGTNTVFGSEDDDIAKTRMRLSHAGWVKAIPVEQGGFSFAIGYSSPITFDNAYSFFGNDRLVGNDRIGYYYVIEDGDTVPDVLRSGGSLYYQEVTNTVHGQLNMINVAAGWQIGPGLAIGFSVNPMFGRAHERLRMESSRNHNGDGLFQNSMETYQRSFGGIDVRMGFLFRPTERVSIGARFALPQYLSMKMDYEFFDSTYYVAEEFSDRVTLKRPFTGAAGAGFVLPFGTMSLEGTFRAPFFEAPEHSSQAYFRLGAAGGLEVPVPFIPVLVRGGYHWQEFDRYPYLYGDGVSTGAVEPNIDSENGEHTASIGFAIMFKDVASLECAYSHYRTDITITNKDWRNDVREEHRDHRAVVQFSYRY